MSLPPKIGLTTSISRGGGEINVDGPTTATFEIYVHATVTRDIYKLDIKNENISGLTPYIHIHLYSNITTLLQNVNKNMNAYTHYSSKFSIIWTHTVYNDRLKLFDHIS